MTTCAVCGVALMGATSEYGTEIGGPVVCLSDWLTYLDWQRRVDAAAGELIATRMMIIAAYEKGADTEDGAAPLLETDGLALAVVGYADFVALATDDGPDWAGDLLEEYDLLPAHAAE